MLLRKLRPGYARGSAAFAAACSLWVLLGAGRVIADPSPAYLVKDINTQPSSGFSIKPEIVSSGGAAYFAATSLETGQELWKSDGTEANAIANTSACRNAR
jgi:hypothetical protein